MWDQGVITSAYFNENDHAAAINLKKGIISLFQYKQDNATEIDTLGKCKTEYRIYDNRLIKDKSSCSNIIYADEFSGNKQVNNNRRYNPLAFEIDAFFLGIELFDGFSIDLCVYIRKCYD
jgi:hypothetical protein